MKCIYIYIGGARDTERQQPSNEGEFVHSEKKKGRTQAYDVIYMYICINQNNGTTE